MPDAGPREVLEPEPVGLGGWLILVAVGLVVSLVLNATGLWRDLLPLFTEETWSVLTSPSSDVYHPLWAPLLIFEALGTIAIIAIAIAIAGPLQFFRRARRFPKLMVVFYVANLVFVAVDYVLVELITDGPAVDDPVSLRQVVRSVTARAIWVPYMYRSRRVANTFVEPVASSS